MENLDRRSGVIPFVEALFKPNRPRCENSTKAQCDFAHAEMCLTTQTY